MECVSNHVSGYLFGTKALCALVLLLIDIFGVALPYIVGLHSNVKDSAIVSIFHAFGLGAMLSLGYIHLLNESVKMFEPIDIEIGGVLVKTEIVWFYFVFTILLLIVLENIGPVFSRVKERCRLYTGSTISVETERPSAGNDSSMLSSSGEYALSSTLDSTYKNRDFSSSVIILSISLAIHSVLEGMIVGFATSPTSAWMITLVLGGHKWIEGFIIGSETMLFTKSFVQAIPAVTFVVASPIGVFLGNYLHCLTEEFERVPLLLSATSIIYVAFTESLEASFGKSRHPFYKFGAMFLGAGLVAFLTLLELRAEILYEK